MKKHILTTWCAVFMMSAALSAGTIIESVNPISSSQPATIEPWVDGVNIYKDREPGHRLVNVPSEIGSDLFGAGQVIQNSNSDKTLADYQIEITTNKLGIIYVGLDSRFADQQPLPWMQDTAKTGLPTIFFDTTRTVDIDEGSTAETAGDDINGSFNIWATIAPPGTYNFFEQTYGGGSNNYFIAADETLINSMIPEPSSLALIGLGLLSLGGLRRRR